MSRPKIAEGGQSAEQTAPGVSDAIHQISLGYIGRWDAERGDYESTDEALIFLNNDNEQTCHVVAPDAKAIAAFIVRAVKSHDALVKALEDARALIDVPGQPLWSDCRAAVDILNAALASAREVQP